MTLNLDRPFFGHLAKTYQGLRVEPSMLKDVKNTARNVNNVPHKIWSEKREKIIVLVAQKNSCFMLKK